MAYVHEDLWSECQAEPMNLEGLATYAEGIGFIQIHRLWHILRHRDDDVNSRLRVYGALRLDNSGLILNHLAKVYEHWSRRQFHVVPIQLHDCKNLLCK